MRRLGCIMLASAALAGACSSGGDDQVPLGEIIRVTPVAVAPQTEAAEPTPAPEGEILNELYLLETGDCFNEYEIIRDDDGAKVELTTRVDCRRPHFAEVYAELDHPAGADVPYPGRRGMELWATQNCYAAFADFVGLDYELSALQIGVIPPAEANWEFGPYRTTECYVYAVDGQLSGTMRDSGV